MINAERLGATALALLASFDVPYVAGASSLTGMDCQGLVKYCARHLGVSLKYAGSNDMFRNACGYLAPIRDAKRDGKIKPGALCFILDRDGKEPDKYKRDGLGNASHVGIVTLDRRAWSVDASASAGKVRGRDERNALSCWTNIGYLKEFEYDEPPRVSNEETHSDAPESVVTAPVGGVAVVTAEPTVTFRKEPRIIPGVDNRVPRYPRIPMGERVETQGAQGDWTKVTYNGYAGWVMTKFLEFSDTAQ